MGIVRHGYAENPWQVMLDQRLVEFSAPEFVTQTTFPNAEG